MNTLTKVKAFMTQKKAQALAAGSAAIASIPAAFATPVIENDTFEGLPDVGEDVGGFLTALLPGIIAVLVAVGIVVGIVAIIKAVAKLLTKGMK